MSQETQEEFNGPAIVTFSNRVQKHMFILTEILGTDNTISMQEKRKLRLLIFNLPPNTKKKLKDVIEKLGPKAATLTTDEYDDMYSRVSDEIYTDVLQEANKGRPRYTKKGHL